MPIVQLTTSISNIVCFSTAMLKRMVLKRKEIDDADDDPELTPVVFPCTPWATKCHNGGMLMFNYTLFNKHFSWLHLGVYFFFKVEH